MGFKALNELGFISLAYRIKRMAGGDEIWIPMYVMVFLDFTQKILVMFEHF